MLVVGTAPCEICGRETAVRKRRPRHFLHSVLTALTAGMWIPIWLIFTFQARWRCGECGSPVRGSRVSTEPGTGPPGPLQRVRSSVRRLRLHFRRYRELRPWPFFWRINIESLLVGLLAGAIVATLVDEPERFLGLSDRDFFLLAVVAAPLLETLIFQCAPIALTRLLGGAFGVQVAASTVPFALAHFLDGVAAGIDAGLVGGFYLAFTYAHWRGKSLWTAWWMTAASHALQNYAIFVLMVCTRGR